MWSINQIGDKIFFQTLVGAVFKYYENIYSKKYYWVDLINVLCHYEFKINCKDCCIFPSMIIFILFKFELKILWGPKER